MMKMFQFFFGRLSGKSKGIYGLTLIGVIGVNAFMVLIPILQKQILDNLQLKQLNIGILIGLLAMSLMVILFSIIENGIMNSLNMSFQREMQMEIFQSGVRYKNKRLDQRGAGAYLGCILGDSEQLSNLYKKNYFYTLMSIATSIVILLITLKWTPYFAAIVSISFVLIGFVLFISNKRYKKEFNDAREWVLKLNPQILENIENRKTLLYDSNIHAIESNLKTDFKRRDAHFKKAFFISTATDTLIKSIQSFAFVVFFVLATDQILKDKLSISSLVAMIGYFAVVFTPMSLIRELVENIGKFKMLYQRVEEVIHKDVKTQLPQKGEIKLDHVSFYYSDKPDNLVLNEVSFNLDKKIGLVGLSGEGKSSIVQIITGQEEAKTGGAFKDGHSIYDHSPFALASMIRVYHQESQIFDKDLIANITLGKAPLTTLAYESKVASMVTLIEKRQTLGYKERLELYANIWGFTEKELENKALNRALMDTLDGLSTIGIENLAKSLVSRTYYIEERLKGLIQDLEIEYLLDRDLGQRGHKISGGEKNAICLCRFLLPVDKACYLIDEPFTSMDVLLEKKALAITKNYLKDEVGIVISHKLDVIKALSDEIILLDNAKIIGKNAHESLLANNEKYQLMWQTFLQKIKATR